MRTPRTALPSCRNLITFIACSAAALAAACKKPEPAKLAPPAALAPAFALLDSTMSAAQQDSVAQRMPNAPVFEPMLVLWLANAQGPWNGVRVADSMRAHGIRVPEHMATVILRAYGAFRRGERVGIDSAAHLRAPADSALSPVVLPPGPVQR